MLSKTEWETRYPEGVPYEIYEARELALAALFARFTTQQNNDNLVASARENEALGYCND